MNRRDALQAGVAAGTRGIVRRPLGAGDDEPRVMTVRGPIPPGEMGPTLPHEHVLVDFIGADKVARDRYDADEVFGIALPHLEAHPGAGRPDAGRVHAGLPGPRPGAAPPAVRGERPAPPDQHRLLRRQRRQVPARRTPGPRRPTRWPRAGSASGATGSTGRASGPASSRSAWTPGRCRRSTASSCGPRRGRTWQSGLTIAAHTGDGARGDGAAGDPARGGGGRLRLHLGPRQGRARRGPARRGGRGAGRGSSSTASARRRSTGTWSWCGP